MEPPSYMRYVVDRNVVMWPILVRSFLFPTKCYGQTFLPAPAIFLPFEET